MRVLFTLSLLALASALVEVLKGYHERVGIPIANKIKAYEDNHLHDNAADEFSRIAGGSRAGNRHPYFAGLSIDLVGEANPSVCGSSLLSTNRLVTAAHCWYDGHYQASQFLVILGSNSIYSGGTRIVSRKVISHPFYNSSSLKNDIAMVNLPVHVNFSDTIRPISLPHVSELSNKFVGQWATAAGYGSTKDDQRPASEINHVKLQVISVGACREVYGSGYVRQSTLCTNGSSGVGICDGDSGGPLVTKLNNRLVLIGISSFVVKDGCRLGYPSAFTRVTSFYYFITQLL